MEDKKLLIRERIIEYLKSGAEATPSQVSDATGINRGTVRRTLQELHAAGRVSRDKSRYKISATDKGAVPDKEKTGQTLLTKYTRYSPPELLGAHSRKQRTHYRLECILLGIIDGKSMKQIAEDLRLKRTDLQYYLSILKRSGMIERLARSNVVIYGVTERAVDLLKAAREAKELPIGRFEHFAMRFKVTTDNPDFLPVSQGSPMDNGVVRTDGKIMVDGHNFTILRWHSPQYDWIHVYGSIKYTTSSTDVIAKSAVECDRVASEIKRRYNMALDEAEVIDTGTMAYNDSFAKEWIRLGGPNVKGSDWWVDRSPPSAKGLSKGAKKGIPGELEFDLKGHVFGEENTFDGYVKFFQMFPEIASKLINTNAQLVELNGQILQKQDVLERGGITMQQQVKRINDDFIMLVGQTKELAENEKGLVESNKQLTEQVKSLASNQTKINENQKTLTESQNSLVQTINRLIGAITRKDAPDSSGEQPPEKQASDTGQG